MKNNCYLIEVFNPRGSRELAPARTLLGGTLPPQRGAHWFRTGRLILVLTGTLVTSVWLPPSLHAGIIFTAGNEIVGPGDNFSVPITVTSTLTPPGVNWGNAGFHLTWDSSVLTLQLTPVNFAGSPLPLAAGNFTPGAGVLIFTWTDFLGNGSPVPTGSTLFTVNYTAVGGASSLLSFDTVATIGIEDSSGIDYGSVTPTWFNGSVTVVPEPINWALGLFACVFIGSATVRWVSSRRMSLQSARAVSHAERRA